jgi:hypothetical protein
MEQMSDGTQQKVSYEVQQTNEQERAKRHQGGTEMAGEAATSVT